ncbi:MAG: ribonuclease E/G [Lachnospiraceae bacterium]|nr:ribonuclease E/G [Lachnospiraceae bacterium]
MDGKTEDITAVADTGRFGVGDIVICKVSEVAEGISSVFVDLGGEKAYLSCKPDAGLRPGTEIPVIIIKEASGSKAKEVSMKLSIAGRYSVAAVPAGGVPRLKISRKIREQQTTERFREAVVPDKYGFDITIRTKAGEADEAEVIKEIETLSGKLSYILEISGKRTPFSILYKAEDPLLTGIRDCRFGDISRIITDIPEMAEPLRKAFPETETVLYDDPMLPLCKLHKIASTVDSVYERRVWLKSGAYLVIDETEAMTVVDVNSGKTDRGNSKEETFLKVNLEAAEELARQIRIRNISGMILVDFINMKNTGDYVLLEEKLKEALRYDLCDCSFIDFTGLGIAELTRRKKRPSLKEVLKTLNCNAELKH